MTDKDTKTTNLTFKATDTAISDSEGNRLHYSGAVANFIKQSMFGEPPSAMVRNNKDDLLCTVPVETFEALRKVDWSAAEVIRGEAVRPSPVGPLSNLCAKDNAPNK